MKELWFVLMCAGFVFASFVVPETQPQKQSCECRCDCYWKGKEAGRVEVRKANAELLKPEGSEQEWPDGTEKPWWADMPAVN
jgi:hypothetical protein